MLRIKNNLVAILLGFVFSLIIVTVPSVETAQAEPDANQMRQSVVHVRTYFANDRVGYGSGFIVDREGQYVVTNRHAVTDEDGVRGYDFYIYVKDQDEPIQAHILSLSPEKDLAILELTKKSGKAPVRFASSDNVKDGQAVYAVGYPFPAYIEKMTNIAQIKHPPESKITRGVISGRNKDDKGTNHYQTDAAVNFGNSGGPLFNEAGAVVGVIRAKPNVKKIESEGIAWAIQSDEVMQYLDRNNIKYDNEDTAVKPLNQPDQSSTSTKGENNANSQVNGTGNANTPVSTPQSQDKTLLIVIGVISVIVLISVVAIMMVQSKKKAAVPSSAANPEVNHGTDRTMPNGKSIGLGPQGLERKGAQENPVTQPVATNPENSRSTKPILRGLVGTFIGRTFEMDKEPLTLGRDSRVCQVIFPPDQTNIGRVHCSIRYEEPSRTFILEDCSSTNGTYLFNGNRTSPNQPVRLKSGDRFYLADRENIFEVLLEKG
ncbi:trypsin-like peptidase domain-containing protein [Heliobacterium chlorum]|uniref:Trypsin-like peptidase domain-containing protein n=1 Tax=Heliobacterium chlorum TaxID=2698 RepID=A0ABR7T0K4_HELCL|nr:trypsin-like peptidase domain-containing protein [Heliobacterium chlorum]MBC9784324.1 trypsin-like peptidase domain-containing protein [Heliobacterium chlorum]